MTNQTAEMTTGPAPTAKKAPTLNLTYWAQVAIKDSDFGTGPKAGKTATAAREAIVKAKPTKKGNNGRIAVEMPKAQAKVLFTFAVKARDERALTNPTPGLHGLRRGCEAIAAYIDAECPAVPSKRKAKAAPDPEKVAAIVEAEAVIDAGESGEKDWGSDDVQHALEVVAKAR